MTEIVAARFILNNVQMPRKLRIEEFGIGTRRPPSVGYQDYVKIVSDMALLSANGNPNKAIEWIYDAYFGSREEKLKALKQFQKAWYKYSTPHKKKQYLYRALNVELSWGAWKELGYDPRKLPTSGTIEELKKKFPEGSLSKVAERLAFWDYVDITTPTKLAKELQRRLKRAKIETPLNDPFWAVRLGWVEPSKRNKSFK
ncbi:MAG: hypothetical protein DRN20_06930 [Thermoplasmata archaeon]|nr:MAG: hypothetical protein DRN20_06930 [Thermoplasmata archaeon]